MGDVGMGDSAIPTDGALPSSLPTNLAEARDAMRDGDADGERLLIVGGGTKQDWGFAPGGVDRIVSAAALDQLLDHDPADMVATVQAGMPLARLQEQLGEHGQALAVDPPTYEGAATVGGIFVAQDSGPRRLKYGSLRELVIGMTYVLADGTVARSGSRVIKNVAGFDLCKLFAGSLGTLGLVVELIVRVHPKASRTVTVVRPADARAAMEGALALLASPLEPVAVDHHDGQLLVQLEGPGADREAERARQLLGGDSAMLEAEAEATRWDAARSSLAGDDGETVVRIGTLPTTYADVANTVGRAASETGAAAALQSHVALGLHTVRLGGDAAAQDRFVASVRAALPSGAYAVTRRRAEISADPFGAEPGGFAVMRRVKDALDPKRRCAPGRFVGGL